MLKLCNLCEIEKDSSEFYTKTSFRRLPSLKSSYSHACKACILAERKEDYRLNPRKRVMADRKQHLKRYGLTIESYNQLFANQRGCCLGCDRHQSEFNRNLVVDHNHETGQVRGLLCVTCNLILGYAQDDIAILQNLIKYLEIRNPVLAGQSNVVDFLITKRIIEA